MQIDVMRTSTKAAGTRERIAFAIYAKCFVLVDDLTLDTSAWPGAAHGRRPSPVNALRRRRGVVTHFLPALLAGR